LKDPALAIRTAYMTALSGNVSLNNAVVPVYDRVPNTAKEPYIRVSEQTGVDFSSKSCPGQETTILFDVVTRFPQGGGKRDADIISNQVMQIVIGGAYPETNDFKVYHVQLDNVNTLEESGDTNYTVRKLIRIRNFVHEKEVPVR